MKPNQQSFLKRNLVTIVVVPGLLLAHYGWWKLQYNDKLVSEEERIDMPIFDVSFRTLVGFSGRKVQFAFFFF